MNTVPVLSVPIALRENYTVESDMIMSSGLLFTENALINTNTNIRVNLQPRLSRFVGLLILHCPYLITRGLILKELDPRCKWTCPSNVAVYIKRLRAILNELGYPNAIETQGHSGYRLLILIKTKTRDLIVRADNVEILRGLLQTHPDSSARKLEHTLFETTASD